MAMRVEIIEKKLLRDIVDPDTINSIFCKTDYRNPYGNPYHPRKVLLVCMKSWHRIPSMRVYNHGIYYINLDKFSYTFPEYVGFPMDMFNNIQLITYRLNGIEYTRARITKKVVW